MRLSASGLEHLVLGCRLYGMKANGVGFTYMRPNRIGSLMRVFLINPLDFSDAIARSGLFDLAIFYLTRDFGILDQNFG